MTGKAMQPLKAPISMPDVKGKLRFCIKSSLSQSMVYLLRACVCINSSI